MNRLIVSTLLMAALYAVTVLVVMQPSKAQPATFVTPRVQLEQKLRAHDGPGARAVGAKLVSLRCRLAGAELPHVYYCAETWRNHDGSRECAEDAFHYLNGQVQPWPQAWTCGTKPPPVPPFPGDKPKAPSS